MTQTIIFSSARPLQLHKTNQLNRKQVKLSTHLLL